jgi:hypothetical protein
MPSAVAAIPRAAGIAPAGEALADSDSQSSHGSTERRRADVVDPSGGHSSGHAGDREGDEAGRPHGPRQ